MTECIVSTERAEARVARLLASAVQEPGDRLGLVADDAARAARWIVEAESLGLRGFGIEMLQRDLDRLRAEAPRHTSLSERGSAPDAAEIAAIGALDATGIPGPLALAAAVRRAESAAREHGVGIVGMRNVGALGVLGLAARDLALGGRVALLTAQAPAVVAPWGGTAGAIGTNPLAFAAPRAGEPPLVADFATSRLTLAELRDLRARGGSLPEGTALDADGSPTTDPASAHVLLAEGRLASLVGLLIEVLAGAATGGRVPAGTQTSGRGATVVALDPARSGGTAAAATVAEIADQWATAGGHVPARFDALPEASGVPGGSVTLTPAAARTLGLLDDPAAGEGAPG